MLIRPSAQAYMDIQQQTRAQNLADALLETIRGEVMEANGYIRFTDGATAGNPDSIFDAKENYSQGTALEFSVYPNHIEIMDKDYVPLLTKTDGTALLTQAQADDLDGYLHMRFYRQTDVTESDDAGNTTNVYKNVPQHKSDTQNYIAYAYTTAYPKDAYMGLYISDLHFYARSWTQDGDQTKTPRITSMTVVLTVSKKDANDMPVALCTQKAVIPLPGEPIILYEPGTWDGRASAES